MRQTFLLAVLASAALGACVGPRGGDERAPEFVGRTLRVQAESGALSTLFLQPDGTVEARFDGKATAGRWTFEDGNLCYLWRNGSYRECWPHDHPFLPGRTETVRSDRGNTVQVTLE